MFKCSLPQRNSEIPKNLRTCPGLPYESKCLSKGLTSPHFAGQAELLADLERPGDVLQLHPGMIINEQLVRRYCEQSRERSSLSIIDGRLIKRNSERPPVRSLVCSFVPSF